MRFASLTCFGPICGNIGRNLSLRKSYLNIKTDFEISFHVDFPFQKCGRIPQRFPINLGGNQNSALNSAHQLEAGQSKLIKKAARWINIPFLYHPP